jgi:hypothetical protein
MIHQAKRILYFETLCDLPNSVKSLLLKGCTSLSPLEPVPSLTPVESSDGVYCDQLDTSRNQGGFDLKLELAQYAANHRSRPGRIPCLE